jgi:hypothetical protein
LQVNSCWNGFGCVNECFLVLFLLRFLCFVCFRLFCLCSPIKWYLIGVETCVRTWVGTVGAGKVGERDNVVSLMSVVVVVNGRVVVSCECDECDDLVVVMS